MAAYVRTEPVDNHDDDKDDDYDNHDDNDFEIKE